MFQVRHEQTSARRPKAVVQDEPLAKPVRAPSQPDLVSSLLLRLVLFGWRGSGEGSCVELGMLD
jgi:hypothetical protein